MAVLAAGRAVGGVGCSRAARRRRAGGLVLVCALAGAALPGSVAGQVSPPAASGVLKDQEVALGATAAVNAAAAFSGPVDSYAARSSDESVVSVAVSGSTVSLRGVAVGSAHLSVQATNSAGARRSGSP